MLKIAFECCGWCNPQVDLKKVEESLACNAKWSKKLQGVELAREDIDVVFILCGYQRASGHKSGTKENRTLLSSGCREFGQEVGYGE